MSVNKSQPPLIGVTGPDRGGTAAWLMTSWALRRAGARAIRLTPKRTYDEKGLDGFVIGGGSDVEPMHYGEEPEDKHNGANNGEGLRLIDWTVSFLLFLLRRVFMIHDVQRYDPERDAMEKHLLTHALRQDLPVLGICRGTQLLNIVLGGSLHQQIHEFYTETPFVKSLAARKAVDIERHSHLDEIFDRHWTSINALHEQAIKALGDGVTVTARDKAGVVQAIEYREARFVVGVQWHPEYLPQMSDHQGLFRALVNAARNERLRHQHS